MVLISGAEERASKDGQPLHIHPEGGNLPKRWIIFFNIRRGSSQKAEVAHYIQIFK